MPAQQRRGMAGKHRWETGAKVMPTLAARLEGNLEPDLETPMPGRRRRAVRVPDLARAALYEFRKRAVGRGAVDGIIITGDRTRRQIGSKLVSGCRKLTLRRMGIDDGYSFE